MRRPVVVLLGLAAGALGALTVGAPAAEAQYFRFGKNRVQYDRADWAYLHAPHVDVYFPHGAEPLAQEAAAVAEAALPRVEALVGHRLRGRVPVVVYPNPRGFATTTVLDLPEGVDGIGGVTDRARNRVVVPFAGDRREFRRVLVHELTHAVVNDRFGSGGLGGALRPPGRFPLPLWMNEGLAEYAALGYDAASDGPVRAALLAGALPPADRLSGYLAYKGGQSFWHFVVREFGAEKVPEILDGLAATRSVEAAFRAATGDGLAGLSARWHDALEGAVFPEVSVRARLREVARPLDALPRTFLAAPALSPDGERVAFVAARGSRLGVYLARTSDGSPLGELVRARATTAFERLRYGPGALAWAPDGRRLAVAVAQGRADAVVVFDTRTRASRAYPLRGVEHVAALAWAPDGRRLAVEAVARGQSDLFLFDPATGALQNLTRDAPSDHAPVWTPDGAGLVFHSDRAGALTLGTAGVPPPDTTLGFDLYRLRLGATRLDRLTDTPRADERTVAALGPSARAAVGAADSLTVLYLSEANGVANLYALDAARGRTRALTDLLVGLDGATITPDGERALVLATGEDGAPTLALLRTPLDGGPGAPLPGPLAPTVFADAPEGPAPAVAFASAERRARNPFLRHAADPAPGPPDGFSGGPPADSAFALADTTGLGALLDSLHAALPPDPRPPRLRFDPAVDLRADGAYRARPYRLLFAPDALGGTAGVDALYGLQGLVEFGASDLLGRHRFALATNLLLDLRNSDYTLAYTYRPGRLDLGAQAFHVARLVPSTPGGTLRFRYRHFGAAGALAFPFDTFRRLDVGLSLSAVSQADVLDPATPVVTRTLATPVVTFTEDLSEPGPFHPVGGRRLAVSVLGSPGALQGETARFATVLGDVRGYRSLARGAYTLAVRASAAGSLGPTPQLFYTAGVANWIAPVFDPNGTFPVADLADFAFATPVLPLRGYRLATRKGSFFGVVNVEARFPLAAALVPGPFPIAPLYRLQGVAFVDAGTVTGGPAGGRFRLLTPAAEGPRRLDDVLVGAGFGVRTLVLGAPLRLDLAWPFDGQSFTAPLLYLSVGADF